MQCCDGEIICFTHTASAATPPGIATSPCATLAIRQTTERSVR